MLESAQFVPVNEDYRLWERINPYIFVPLISEEGLSDDLLYFATILNFYNSNDTTRKLSDALGASEKKGGFGPEYKSQTKFPDILKYIFDQIKSGEYAIYIKFLKIYLREMYSFDYDVNKSAGSEWAHLINRIYQTPAGNRLEVVISFIKTLQIARKETHVPSTAVDMSIEREYQVFNRMVLMLGEIKIKIPYITNFERLFTPQLNKFMEMAAKGAHIVIANISERGAVFGSAEGVASTDVFRALPPSMQEAINVASTLETLRTPRVFETPRVSKTPLASDKQAAKFLLNFKAQPSMASKPYEDRQDRQDRKRPAEDDTPLQPRTYISVSELKEQITDIQKDIDYKRTRLDYLRVNKPTYISTIESIIKDLDRLTINLKETQTLMNKFYPMDSEGDMLFGGNNTEAVYTELIRIEDELKQIDKQIEELFRENVIFTTEPLSELEMWYTSYMLGPKLLNTFTVEHEQEQLNEYKKKLTNEMGANEMGTNEMGTNEMGTNEMVPLNVEIPNDEFIVDNKLGLNDEMASSDEMMDTSTSLSELNNKIVVIKKIAGKYHITSIEQYLDNAYSTTPNVETNVVEANVVGTKEVEANVVEANVVGTKEVETNVVGTSATEMVEEAKEVEANVVGTNVVGTNVVGTSEVGTNVVGTSEVGTNVVGTNVVGTNVVGTNVVGTNVVGTSEVVSDTKTPFTTRVKEVAANVTTKVEEVVDKVSEYINKKPEIVAPAAGGSKKTTRKKRNNIKKYTRRKGKRSNSKYKRSNSKRGNSKCKRSNSNVNNKQTRRKKNKLAKKTKRKCK